MKKFDIDCDFGGQKSKFTIYIGTPQDGHHPLQFQSKWLSDERGGTIPDAVMDAVKQLYDISKKNNVSFEDLCVYALGTAQEAYTTSNDEDETEREDNDDEDNKAKQA
ncbi:DUF2610 domain-containing protein [Rickettsia endosymbiont of Urophora cardui]|uniref:DUF2610 domain-containing protein n=1 Tax=Rickettsia endosymbiont of Urophora cardui TaxID=3066265 RepID=UPI00313EF941